jgi:glycosyltransferase involved in cell wall biosynthesis
MPPAIAILSSEYPPFMLGGLGTHVHELVKGLARLDHEILVFAYAPVAAQVRREGRVTVCFVALPPDAGPSVGFPEIMALNERLFDAAAEHFRRSGTRPGALHCHDWFAFPAAARLRDRFRIPVVSTLHYLADPYTRRWGEQTPPEVRQQERAICTGSDALIAVSAAMKRDIVNLHRVAADRVTVVHNGFDPAPFQQEIGAAELAALRARFAPRGERLVVFAGRFIPMKGLSALLRSAALLAAERDDVAYVLAGELQPSPYVELHTGLARDNPRLRGRVHFPGRLERRDLVCLYRVARMAVVPSLWEPFGYAATEAMAAGTPVIASGTGGLAEIIEPERSGLLVPLKPLPDGLFDVDVPRLAEAQRRLLDDDALAERLAAAGRERVLASFRFESMVERTAAVYAAAIARGPAAASAPAAG